MTVSIQPAAPEKKDPNLSDKVLFATFGLLANYPDVLSYATVGAIIYGLPGAAIGAVAALIVRCQIVPQDHPSRHGLILSQYQPQGPCGLKGCNTKYQK